MNLMLQDIYGDQRIIREKVIPPELVLNSPNFCRAMMGLSVPKGVYVHVAGVDLIENERGEFLVLEDNLRVPSGVSYLLENRIVMSRVVPDLLKRHRVRRVDHYPQILLEALRNMSEKADPSIVVLTPGIYNSAYFEHSYLAAQMGVQLVEGRDLIVDDNKVYMKTTSGLKSVDVVYRRVDDEFMDPVAFRSDSILGVPGLMNAYRKKNVVLANAPGTGVVDDKAMYVFVPDAIRFYLDEEPLLPQVPTYMGGRPDDLSYMLDHLKELVVKPTDGSGGGRSHAVCARRVSSSSVFESVMEPSALTEREPTLDAMNLPASQSWSTSRRRACTSACGAQLSTTHRPSASSVASALSGTS